MEKINVVFSSDNNYAQYMGVAICSLFENKKCQNEIGIHVLDGGISEDNKAKLSILEDKYNFKINYIKINPEEFNGLWIRDNLTCATYYRLVIPETLPNVDKIIYLDCDIVIVNDLKELYDTEIQDYYIGAVDEEKYPKNIKSIELFKKEDSPKGTYFNSGVMLINSKKWREDNLSQKLLQYTRETHGKFYYCDQDVLNSFVGNMWKQIPYKYNYMTLLMTKKHPSQKIKDVSIIHYIYLKPWNYLCNYPLKKYYFKYLAKTPWKNEKYINRNLKTFIIKYFQLGIMYLIPKPLENLARKTKQKIGIKFY